jgi:hypothetical protein
MPTFRSEELVWWVFVLGDTSVLIVCVGLKDDHGFGIALHTMLILIRGFCNDVGAQDLLTSGNWMDSE